MRVLDYSNESFVQVFNRYYYNEGSKSVWDILTIHDIDLISKDPFDENLDSLYKEKIKYEISINPWYFLRKCIKVPNSEDSLMLTNNVYVLIDSILSKEPNIINSMPRTSMKNLSIASLVKYFRVIGKYDEIFINKNIIIEDIIDSLIIPSFLEVK